MPENDHWNIASLKEYFEKILTEKDKALAAALVAVKEEGAKTERAAEKRFDLLNELRSGVATREQLEALEKIVNELNGRITRSEGKGSGLAQGWVLLLGLVSLIGGILGIISFVK